MHLGSLKRNCSFIEFNFDFKYVPIVITTCCILHNFYIAIRDVESDENRWQINSLEEKQSLQVLILSIKKSKYMARN